jgi:hypothetical protein
VSCLASSSCCPRFPRSGPSIIPQRLRGDEFGITGRIARRSERSPFFHKPLTHSFVAGRLTRPAISPCLRVIRDSVEGTGWRSRQAAKATGRGTGRSTKNRQFLDKSAGALLSFFRKKRQAWLAFVMGGQRQGKGRKWRSKPLKSPEMDSEMAIRRFAIGGACLSTIRAIARWA